MTWMTQRNSSGDPPISKLTAILQWKADSMSYINKYYGHKEGTNDMHDSDVFIVGSRRSLSFLDIKSCHKYFNHFLQGFLILQLKMVLTNLFLASILL